MATPEYNPWRHSVVQAVTGIWERFKCDYFHEALLDAILNEIKRVHWNVYGHQWGPTWHSDEIEDPGIPGILFTRYYDGCACEDEDKHRPDCRHARPNFQFEDVAFRWYKYPGRGMSTNKDMSSDDWRGWFNRCIAHVQAFDVDLSSSDRTRTEALAASLRARHPQAFEQVTPADERESMEHMFGAFAYLDHAQTPCWSCSEAGFGGRGGGVFEGGPHGMVARTLHEDDNPTGPCLNCGHINTDEQAAEMEAIRRKNGDHLRDQLQDE